MSSSAIVCKGLTRSRIIGFAYLLLSATAQAQVVKCTTADGSIQYASKADALKMTQEGTSTCAALKSDKGQSVTVPKLPSYDEWQKKNAHIKSVGALRLSDLYSYIGKSSPDLMSKESSERWLADFPPYTTGFFVEYPVIARSDAVHQNLLVVDFKHCGSNEKDAFITELYTQRDKYLGQNAFGATREVSKKSEQVYCVHDESFLKASFQFDKQKYKETTLTIVAKVRIKDGPGSDFYKVEPRITRPVDVSRMTVFFNLQSIEYMLIHKPTGEILDRVVLED